jgi:hypothetical protein
MIVIYDEDTNEKQYVNTPEIPKQEFAHYQPFDFDKFRNLSLADKKRLFPFQNVYSEFHSKITSSNGIVDLEQLPYNCPACNARSLANHNYVTYYHTHEPLCKIAPFTLSEHGVAVYKHVENYPHDVKVNNDVSRQIRLCNRNFDV